MSDQHEDIVHDAVERLEWDESTEERKYANGESQKKVASGHAADRADRRRGRNRGAGAPGVRFQLQLELHRVGGVEL